MKTIINKIQLSILIISLASTVTIAQIPRDSVKVEITNNAQRVGVKIDTVTTKMDFTRLKVVCRGFIR